MLVFLYNNQKSESPKLFSEDKYEICTPLQISVEENGRSSTVQLCRERVQLALGTWGKKPPRTEQRTTHTNREHPQGHN